MAKTATTAGKKNRNRKSVAKPKKYAKLAKIAVKKTLQKRRKTSLSTKPAKKAKSVKAIKKPSLGKKVAKPAKKKSAQPASKKVAKPVALLSKNKKPAKTTKTPKAAKSAKTVRRAKINELATNKKRANLYTPNNKEKYMSDRQVFYFTNNFYKTLAAIDHTTNRTMDALRGSDQPTPDENDRASKEASFSLELRERERESFLVNKIRHALQRIKSKDFGYCEECSDKIGLPRLLARPVATLCFECKNLQEYKEKIHS